MLGMGRSVLGERVSRIHVGRGVGIWRLGRAFQRRRLCR